MKWMTCWLVVLGTLMGLTHFASAQATPGAAADAELVETRREVPKLAAAAAYEPKDKTLDIELSDYAGYAGLIAANGGLEPTEDSVFFKRHGFKVHITISEEESWSALNGGKMAASATTADVVAVYGKQFNVVVPALISYSRGADAIVVRSDIKRINDLKGKVLATCQFTESDFLIRYLAGEANLGINLLDDLSARPDPDKVNIVACADGFGAGDLFLRDVQSGRNRLAGCVTWEPKTKEVVEKSAGKAKTLITNTNLLIVADVLVFNRQFAAAHTDMMAGVVDGLIVGNQMVKDDPEHQLPIVAKALKWAPADAADEIKKVHLANLPENVSFFDGTIDSAGSFGFIFESSVAAYGPAMIPTSADADAFMDTQALKALEKSGRYAAQVPEIVPVKSAAAGTVEQEPLLSKNIRFVFQPNSAVVDMNNETNKAALKDFAQLLKIAPGSTVALRGHAEGSLIEKFRKQGEAKLKQMALSAKQLSKERAEAVGKMLADSYKVDAARIKSVGRGWEEPISEKPEENRRVELQWFTVE